MCINREKAEKKPLTCVGEIEKHLDENADPNKQGPSPRRRVKRKQVVSSSEDEWLPQDESQETIVDAEDDNILLLPEEWRNENQAGGIALCDALEVEYLDHGRRGGLCCHDGKAAFLADHFDKPAPEPLRSLWDDRTSQEGTCFHKKIRYINAALQMASSTSNVVHTPGVSMMVAQGSIYHLLNPIETSQDPQYVQIYMMDDQEEELACRIRKMNESSDPERQHPERREETEAVRRIVGELQSMLHTCNPYVEQFKLVEEQLQEQTKDDVMEFEVDFIEAASNDPHVYNKPHASEVMAVVDDREDPKEKRGLRLLARNRVDCKKPVIIWDNSPMYEPLHFVLLYPWGTPGWHTGMGLTPLQYGAYWLHDRAGAAADFTKGGRLFQEWVLDTYVKVERQRLNYLKTDEFRRKMRRSALGPLRQAVAHGRRKGSEAGTEAAEVPASHIGSRAYFRKKRYDAYALARAFGNPSLFITMTCNPNWPEIQREIRRGQAAQDRPDIVSRVFHAKLRQLKDDLIKGKVFGEAKALTYRVEYQKRGLPHVHMLLWLEDQAITTTGEGIEKVSRAWIPDEKVDPHGHHMVASHMMHGPPNNTRVVEKKLENGDTVKLDNRYVVPYNMYLLKRYNCHLNVMVCSGIEGIKYMFKYVYKEASRSNVSLSERREATVETVDNFFDGLCIGSAEACWRLFGFELAGNYPSVQQLHLHTPNDQSVLFEEEGNLVDVVQEAGSADTMLTAWFKFNLEKHKYQARLAGAGEGATVRKPAALSTCYADIGAIATWGRKMKRWTRRTQSTGCVSRLPFVHPQDRERWCLKQLLCALPGATSWDDLKTVRNTEKGGNPTVCPSFEEACRLRGMLENDDLWCSGMDEAVREAMPCQLRMMFVEMLAFCNISDPKRLWNRYKTALSEDYLYEVDTKLKENPEDCIRDTVAEDEHGRWSWRAVLDIQDLLDEYKKTLEEFGIPRPPDHLITSEIEKEVGGYFNFSYQDIEANVAKLNQQQRAAFDQILEAVNACESGRSSGCHVFFLDGIGGSGKTFLYKTLLMKLRKQSQEERERGEHPIAVAMASNGLPAQLLPNGTTVHRRFRLPVKDDVDGEQLICNVARQSHEADLLRRARLIVWDEAPAMNKWQLDAVDRCLRDIMARPDTVMGGKVVVLGGDFRQCGPVMKNARGRARRMAEVNASLTHWTHWPAVKVLRLHINMRVENCVRPECKSRLEGWSRWLKRVGDGEVPLDDHGRLEVPSSIAFTPEEGDPESMEKTFFEHVYAGLQAKRGQDRDDFLKGTAVLVPKNDTATRINDSLLDALIDGEEDRLFVSINGITDGWHQRDDAYPEEYLASIKESGLPPHVIRLKVGAPIIALRNITKGVSNGTRLVVTKILNHSIKARVVHGPSTGREVLITRVVMTQTLGSFVLQRTQLPIRVAFAMTINKAQGLTLQRVGVYLQDDVFSHGQLYVALSRCGDDQNLWVFGPHPDDQGKLWMRNVVYKEILIDTYH
eukprot:jgi/Picre1/34423/NNA_001892.t1